MTTVNLRTYQSKGIIDLNQAIKKGYKRILWVYPTGAGKSTVTSAYVKTCVTHKKRVLFMVHSKELVEQFAQRLLSQFNIHSGVIMAGIKPRRQERVQVASVQSLKNRKLPPADIIFIDEAHRSKADTYLKIINQYPPQTIVVGLTATPFRGDGQGLGDIYEHIVHPIKISELMTMGFLVPTKVFIPKKAVNLNNINIVNGDYDISKLADEFSKSEVIDGVIENYIKHSNNKKMIVFNVNIEHSKLTNQRFLDEGIPSAHLDGETDKKTRERIIAKFKRGEIMVLHNVGLFTEGFDVPDTEGVILNRATRSKPLYIQMIGRGLRPADQKKECIVLDHGGNTLRHGFVETYDAKGFHLSDTIEYEAEEQKPKLCKVCEEGINQLYDEDEDFRYYKCTNCDNLTTAKKRQGLQIGEQQEFILLEKDIKTVEYLNSITQEQAKETLDLSDLRIYQQINSLPIEWLKETIHYKGVEVETDKEVDFVLALEERKKGRQHLLKELKTQGI